MPAATPRAEDAVTVAQQPSDSTVGDETRARLHRLGHQGAGHGLFDRAAGFVVMAEHPWELDGAPPELRGASLQHRGGRRRRARELGDRQLGLDAGGVPVEDRRGELVDLIRAAPFFGELGGESVIEAAVDLGAATNAAALGIGDAGGAKGGGQASVAVLGDHLVERKGLHGVGVDPRPLFDDGHVSTGSGQGRGRDRTAGAGTDDEHVGLEGGHGVVSGINSFAAKRSRDWSSRTYWRTGSKRLVFQPSTRCSSDAGSRRPRACWTRGHAPKASDSAPTPARRYSGMDRSEPSTNASISSRHRSSTVGLMSVATIWRSNHNMGQKSTGVLRFAP